MKLWIQENEQQIISSRRFPKTML